MRTLLNESLPPQFNDEPAFSPPQKNRRLQRTFSENAVFSTNEPNLVEVGVDGTVPATSGASADSARSAPERGLTALRAERQQLKESPVL